MTEQKVLENFRIGLSNFWTLILQSILILTIVLFVFAVFDRTMIRGLLMRQENLDSLSSKLSDEPMEKFTTLLAENNKFRLATSIDCLVFHTNCTTNDECEAKCMLSASPFVCHKKANVCVPVNADAAQAVSLVTKCNSKHGILSLMYVDPSAMLGSDPHWKCLSLYRDFVDDFDTKIDSTCRNGVLKFDIIKNHRAPGYQDCTCKTNEHRVLGILNDFVVPRCVRHQWLYWNSYHET